MWGIINVSDRTNLSPVENMLQLVENVLGWDWGLAGGIEGRVVARNNLYIGEILLLPLSNVFAIFSPTCPFHRNGHPSP